MAIRDWLDANGPRHGRRPIDTALHANEPWREAAAPGGGKAAAAHEGQHARVADQHLSEQPPHSGGAGRIEQRCQKPLRQPQAPEGVGHHDGEFGRFLVAGHGIAGFADDLLCTVLRDREHEGDMVALIDTGQCLQRGFRQFIHRAMEAQPARCRRQGTDEALQPGSVVGPDSPQCDGRDATRRLPGREQADRRDQKGAHRCGSRGEGEGPAHETA